MPPRHAFSAFAVWSGVYVSGATLFFIQMTNSPGLHPLWIALMAWATGTGVYLLDRVKLKDDWLDPADQAARPHHHALITARPRAARIAAVLLLAGAMLIALFSAPADHLALIETLPAAAVLGVAIYAARPRRERPRPKDILAFKNAYTATGITALAILLTLCILPPPARLTNDAAPVWLFAAAALWARVFTDAALCDLDDHEADAQFGTRTFAIAIGRSPTRHAAIAARMLIAISLALVPIGPEHVRTAWATLSAASTLTLLPRKKNWRDPIDLSLGIEAACVAAYLALTQ